MNSDASLAALQVPSCLVVLTYLPTYLLSSPTVAASLTYGCTSLAYGCRWEAVASEALDATAMGELVDNLNLRHT